MRRHVLQLIVAVAIVVIPLVAVFATDTKPQLGLDLQGGISVVLAPKQGFKAESGTLCQATEHHPQPGRLSGGRPAGDQPQVENIIVELPGVPGTTGPTCKKEPPGTHARGSVGG